MISVLMPFRDAAATLPAALDSIAVQTLREWELVAVDDGSRDGSAAAVEKFASTHGRTRLLETGGKGIVAALQSGLAVCEGAIVARMDADDRMHPERLDTQRRWLEAHPDDAVVGSLVEIFPAESVTEGTREYLRWLNACVTREEIANQRYVESPLPHPSVVFRRDAVLAAGGYRDGDFPEDYDLWLRLLERGASIAKVPRVLLWWRESASRASRTIGRYARESFDRLRAEYLVRDPRVRSGRGIVFWGAGRRTRPRIRLLRERGVEAIGFIDIDPDKIGYVVEGLPVHPPEWLDRSDRPFVLVYVASHGARDVIAARLEAFGYRIGSDWLPVG